MKTLTKYQKETLDYIKKYIKKNGYSPSFSEMQKEFKLKNIGAVWYRINYLHKKGFIEKEKFTPRTLKIVNNIEKEIIEFIKNFNSRKYNSTNYKKLITILKNFQSKLNE